MKLIRKKYKTKKGGMEGIRSKDPLPKKINTGNYLKGLIIPGTDKELNINDEVAFSRLMKAIDNKDNDLIKEYLICRDKKYYEDVIGAKLGSGVYGAVYQYGLDKVLKLSHSETDEESESGSESDSESESASSEVKSSAQKIKEHQESMGTSSYQSIADSMKSVAKSSSNESEAESEDISESIKETLIQHILSCTERQDIRSIGLSAKKTLAPKVYELFYTMDDGYFRLGIVMEQLAGDVHDLSHSEHFLIDPKNSLIFLEDIAMDLDVAIKRWGFSHRDLKLDNIMYKTKTVPSKRNLYYLIDFGFSCMTFNGGLMGNVDGYDNKIGKVFETPLVINCLSLETFSKSTCENKYRDLTQMSYNIWDNYQLFFPENIWDFCKENIQKIVNLGEDKGIIGRAQSPLPDGPAKAAIRRHRTVNLTSFDHATTAKEYFLAGVPKEDLSELGFGGWSNLYPFINENDIDNERCQPSVFIENLRALYPSKGGRRTVRKRHQNKLGAKKKKLISKKQNKRKGGMSTEPNMEINIKSYDGDHYYVIYVQPNDDIYESILEEMKDTMMYQIVNNVFFGEEIIVPDSTFEEYGIETGATLYMNIGRKRASFTQIVDDLVLLNPHLKAKKKELSFYEVWDENLDNVIGRNKVTVDSKEPWKVTGNLDWDNKQIKQLPESIGDLNLDGIFQLDENDFTTLPNSFGGLEVSEDLFMGHGKLQKLPDNFGDLKVGKGLYLSNNKLESLPESFNNLTVGDDIWLSYNKLSELPDTPPNTGGVIMSQRQYPVQSPRL